MTKTIPTPSPINEMSIIIDDRKLIIEDCGTFYLDRIYFISELITENKFPNRISYFYLNEQKIVMVNGDNQKFENQYNIIKTSI